MVPPTRRSPVLTKAMQMVQLHPARMQAMGSTTPSMGLRTTAMSPIPSAGWVSHRSPACVAADVGAAVDATLPQATTQLLRTTLLLSSRTLLAVTPPPMVLRWIRATIRRRRHLRQRLIRASSALSIPSVAISVSSQNARLYTVLPSDEAEVLDDVLYAVVEIKPE